MDPLTTALLAFPLVPLIAFGSLYFWLGLIAIAGVVCFLAKEDHPWLITLLLFATLVTTTLFTTTPVIPFIIAHWQGIIAGVVVWLALGVCWMYFDWRVIFVPDKIEEYALRRDIIRDRYEGDKKEYEKYTANRLSKPDAYYSGSTFDKIFNATETHEFTEYKKWVRDVYNYPPLMLENTSMITIWIIYWPFCALYELLNNPLRRFVNWVIRVFGGAMERISRAAFADRFEEFK